MAKLSAVVLFVLYFANCQSLPPPCESEIYCHGDLLHTVQLARVYGDSKTFVDKKQIHSPNQTLLNFKKLMNETNQKPSKEKIIHFLNENFVDGNELDTWEPSDYQPNPAFLNEVKNVSVREFASSLIHLWPKLSRKVKDEVSVNLDRYSIIPVPNGFIIPGGRFREFYYWDSYWIIKGLLISEMFETARGMIDNFCFIVQKYGFMPNGGRIYYLNRSQPPLLTAMAYDYFRATSDIKWVKGSIEHLARELHFWLDKRSVSVMIGDENITLARYYVPNTGPRPESYSEDYLTASNSEDAEQMYIDLKSGAESGWDFSTRWFFDSKGRNNANISKIGTSRVFPVDLNAYLCGAFRDIASMYSELGDDENRKFWEDKYESWKKSVNIAFWHEEDGAWFDLDSEFLEPRKYFYPSNLSPLWSRCYEPNDGGKLGRAVVDYLNESGILEHLGGVPASLEESGEQWDFPNAWPPLQDIVVQGLRLTGVKEAEDVANDLARRWINANVLGFNQTSEMFEKYDAVVPGRYGGGGEYTVQTGFGWSNGVALKLIHEYYRI